jgi:serine/threonine-protein kinase
MIKWLDCEYVNFDDKRQYAKAYFVDGSVVGVSGVKYQLNGFIAQGGNGAVFRCYTDSRAAFAVKFLRILDKQRRERFEFEGLILNDLDHPGIIRIHDTGLVDTTIKHPIPFIITDIFSTNIEHDVRNGRLFSIADIKKYGMQICEAFTYLHSQGVIHRDIKPGNFLIEHTAGKIVISDFGLAKTYTEDGSTRFWRGDMTTTDERIGSVPWMSPELLAYARNKTTRVDHRSDIFSLGRVFWFMHTGDIAGIADEDEDQSGGKLFGILTKATQKNVDKRFQSADELLGSLREL